MTLTERLAGLRALFYGAGDFHVHSHRVRLFFLVCFEVTFLVLDCRFSQIAFRSWRNLLSACTLLPTFRAVEMGDTILGEAPSSLLDLVCHALQISVEANGNQESVLELVRLR